MKWVGTLAIAWAIASPAAAQSSFAEVQVDSQVIGDFFRAQLLEEARHLCPEEVPALLCGGEECFLDHLDVPTGGAFVWGETIDVPIDGRIAPVQGTQLQFVQPIRIFTKTSACVFDVDCPRDEYATERTLHLVADVHATADSLCVTPAGFQEPGFPLDAMPAGVGETCVPLELDAIDALVENSLEPSGTALSANADATRLAVRMEFLPIGFDALPAHFRDPINASRRAVWQSFLGHAISSAPGLEHGFGVLLTRNMIEQAINGRTRRQILDSSDVEINDGPSTTFSWYLGPDGHIGTYVDVLQSVAVCPNTIGVEVNISMPITFAGGELVLDGLMQWNVTDSDVLLCTTVPPGAPLTTIIAAIVASEYTPDTEDFTASDCVVSEVDDGISTRCTTAVDDVVIQNGNALLSLRFDGATPSGAGLTLHGTATALGRELENASGLEAHGSLVYGVQGDACRGGSIGYVGGIGVNRPTICDVRLVGDEHDVYRVHTIASQTASVEFPTIASSLCETSPGVYGPCSGASPLDQFWVDPYGAEVVVMTTRGIDGIRLDTPERPTASEEAAMQASFAAQRGLCHELETGLFGIPGMYDWRWDVDPPDYLVKMVTDGRVRQVGTVTLTNVRLRQVHAMTSYGALRTMRVQMVLEATATVDAGRAGVHRTGISVPFMTSVEYASDGVRVRGVRSRSTVSAAVTFDRTAPTAIRGATFDLALAPGAIRVVPSGTRLVSGR